MKGYILKKDLYISRDTFYLVPKNTVLLYQARLEIDNRRKPPIIMLYKEKLGELKKQINGELRVFHISKEIEEKILLYSKKRQKYGPAQKLTKNEEKEMSDLVKIIYQSSKNKLSAQ